MSPGFRGRDTGAAYMTIANEDLIEQRLTTILTLYREKGDATYGEGVSQSVHALQCAAFAEEMGAEPALIIATLLHDIGHLLHNQGEDIAEKGVDMAHQVIGEKYLARWFPDRVARPVGMHADAKRYLCTVEQGYFEGLSPASVRSLALQGGRMTDNEVDAFEQDPMFEDAILLRRCDEKGKDPDLKTRQFTDFVPMIRTLLAEHMAVH